MHPIALYIICKIWDTTKIHEHYSARFKEKRLTSKETGTQVSTNEYDSDMAGTRSNAEAEG